MILRKTFYLVAITIAVSLSACGDSRSSSGSSSSPSCFNSDQKSKYNNLTPEGKAYVDQQMRNYDNSKK